MKVKNIMFSGFAAAILMGVAAEANAAPATKVVASKGYVDAVTGELGNLGGAARGKTNLVEAVNVKLDPVNAVTGGLAEGEYYSSVTQTAEGQVAVAKGQLAAEIAKSVKIAPTTDAVYQAIQEVSGDIKTYYDGTDIDIDENNKVNATYGSLNYESTADAADNANKLTDGYAVSYVSQVNGKVKIGAKQYTQNVNAVSAAGPEGKNAPSTKAVYDALQDKQDALTEAQELAVNSGITAGKVSTYDGYATSKQDALNADQLAAVNSTITAEKVATFAAKQDALSEGQLAATNSGITAGKVSTYDGYATSKQDALTTAQLGAVNSGITATKVQQYDAIPVMPAACQESGVVCVLSSEEGVYMWSVLAQPYAYTSGEAATVTDGITAQEQKINPDVNPHL